MIRRRALNLLAALAAVGIAACSSAPPAAQDTTVRAGDVMHGRMVEGRPAQSFTFEGVESSLLDFTVHANQDEAAPVIAVQDPEGRDLDVAAATDSKDGDATVSVTGLVLPKTGMYRVVARPAMAGRTVYYRFKHRLRFAPPPPRKAYLSADAPNPVYVSAPRGGLIAFTITPDRGSDVQPDVVAVKDPWGGPALDTAQVPAGALPPRVSHSHEGAMILTFTAPRPGLYTILAGAKPGTSGVGTLAVDIRQPAASERFVYHGGGVPRAYGVSGPFGSPDAGEARPQLVPSRPPPPPMPVSRVAPASPPEEPIAQR